MNDGTYKRLEVKYKIDTAIQRSMWEFRDASNKEDIYTSLLDAQSRLYEEFEID